VAGIIVGDAQTMSQLSTSDDNLMATGPFNDKGQMGQILYVNKNPGQAMIGHTMAKLTAGGSHIVFIT